VNDILRPRFFLASPTELVAFALENGLRRVDDNGENELLVLCNLKSKTAPLFVLNFPEDNTSSIRSSSIIKFVRIFSFLQCV
jgi:hypothetical protein